MPEPLPNPTSSSETFQEILRTLRRHWLAIVVSTVGLAALSAGLALTKENQYSATASLLFRDPQLDQKLFGSGVLGAVSTDPDREAATNVQLVDLASVAALTAEELGEGLTPGTVSNAISVESQGQSNVVGITATDPNPAISARIANTYAEQFIAFRVAADRSKIDQARELVERQYESLDRATQAGPQGRTLLEQAEQLRTFSALQTGNAELVQHAQPPTAPSSPKPRRDGLIGGVIGLVIGLAMAFLFDRLDRRIRDVDDLESEFGLPVLAVIPESRALANQDAADDVRELRDREAFRMLHTQLRYFNVDRELRRVLVTSGSPGDGKSTVALNLARAAAGSAETRVLLLETDFRRPTLGARLGVAPNPGLAELLTRADLAIEDVVRTAPDQERLDVIPAGAIPPNPVELIESAKLQELLTKLSARYDFIVLDTAPAAVISDPLPLIQQVDGVIIVARIGRTTRDALRHLHNQLVALGGHILGVVPNGAAVSRSGQYSRYGYGYAYEDANASGPLGDASATEPSAGSKSTYERL